MKKYRAAIVGCGRIAGGFDAPGKGKTAFTHAKAYRLTPGVDLVAVCDQTIETARTFARRWGVPAYYGNVEAMLTNEGVDILSVCTPAETHWDVVHRAVKYPLKAVYCEKPLDATLRNARQIVKRSAEKKILLMVNVQRRFDPFHRELRQKITDGRLGVIQQAHCYYTRGIMNTGIHIIDLLCFLFGRPQWVFGQWSRQRSPLSTDPNIDGQIQFHNGPLVSLQACDDRAFLILELDILGTKARVRIGQSEECFQVKKGGNLLRKPQLEVVKSLFRTRRQPISLTHGVRHILRCLEGKERPVADGAQALEALGIIEQLRQSALSGKMKKVYV